MKLLTKISFAFFSFLLLITAVSCDRDVLDDGYFKVGEKSYVINEAVLTDVGYEDGYYQLRLSLDNTNNNDFHSINFLMYSEVNEYLPSGLYTPYLYDDNYRHKFKRGAWTKGDVEAGVILLGKVKVSKSNEIYNIHIDCKDHNGNIVVGEYEGKIRVIL